MTDEEIQIITNRVIDKLRKDSVMIEQLQNTNALSGTDLLELDKGRNVSLDDLKKFIRGAGIYLEIIGRNDFQTVPTDNNVFSALRTLYEISKNNDALKNIFLRKDQPEFVKFLMTLEEGAVFGKEFLAGLTGHGGKIDRFGNAELESLVLRKFLEVPELRFNRTKVYVGNTWFAAGGGIIEDVKPDRNNPMTGTAWLKLEEGEIGCIKEKDICMGIFHSETADIPNEAADEDDGHGNFKFAGFYTCYFTITSVQSDPGKANNRVFTYALREPTKNWPLTYHPSPSMHFACYGTFNEKDNNRSKSIYLARNYVRMLKNVHHWEFDSNNIGLQFGDFASVTPSSQQMQGEDLSKYVAVLDDVLFKGQIKQIKKDGTPIRTANDCGKWTQKRYDYYDRVSHNGGLWLCIAEGGTDVEPSKQVPSIWLCEVSPGQSMTSFSRWHSDMCPYPVNAMLNMAGRVVITNEETSVPPFPLITDKNGNYIVQSDGSYIIGSYDLNPQWTLIMDESKLKDGADGASLEVRYSADKVSWHEIFADGDKFMQQRVGDGSWSGAMQIVGENGLAGDDGPYSEFEFAVGDSMTQAPTEGWQDAPKAVGTGQFLWMRTRVVNPAAGTTTSWATARIGGEKGDAGVSVTGVVNWYLASDKPEGVTVETAGWTPALQPISRELPYLWNYEEVSYSEGNPTHTDPSVKAYYTEDGKGIVSVTEYYGLSDDAKTLPTTWYTEPKETTPDSRYLWNYEVIAFTEGKPHVTDKRIIGTHGEKGDGYTQHGHWHSGITIPKLGVVEMAGSSYVARVATQKPPLFCITDKGGNYITQKDGGYILTGERNPEYDLFVAAGKDGLDGIPGKPGRDGKIFYTWLRYADDAQGNGMSNLPDGKKFLGLAYNKETPVESDNPKDYMWSDIKGEQGVKGETGADGKPKYTWIQYSDYPTGYDADGKAAMYQQPRESTKYIGIRPNNDTETEGDIPSDYTWSRFKGEDGENPISADLDNEMDSIPLSSDGKLSKVMTITTTASVWEGSKSMSIKTITANVAAPLTAKADTTGLVSVTVPANVEIPSKSTVSITLAPDVNGAAGPSRNLMFTLVGVRAGAKGEVPHLYKLRTSVSSVVRRKDGTFSSPDVSIQALETINGVEALYNAGTIKFSVDGSASQTIANNGTVPSHDFANAVKFTLYDPKGNILDTESVPMIVDGEDGKPGRSITSIQNFYTANNKPSGVTIDSEAGKWVEDEPQGVSPNKRYLWNFERVNYSAGLPDETKPSIILMYAEDGKKGDTGNDGVGIVHIYDYYGLGDESGVNKWEEEGVIPQVTATDRYLWTKEDILFTSGYTKHIDPHVIAVYGEKGDDGVSPVYAIIDNEMDTVVLSSEGKTERTETIRTNVSVYSGTQKQEIAGLILDKPGFVRSVDKYVSTGEIIFNIDPNVTVPARTEIKITIRASIDGVMQERTVVFVLAGVRQGDDAVLYRLVVSETVVHRDSKGGINVPYVYACRTKTVGNVSQDTTDGTLSYIKDNEPETSCSNNEHIVVMAVYNFVKFIFRDTAGRIVDSQTIHIVSDGKGLRNRGAWHTGMETIVENDIVTMAGSSFVCKVASTTNPPLFCVTDKNGNRITQKDGGYILTGEQNKAEYDKIAEKGEKGEDGRDGQDGTPGAQGLPGIDGCNYRISEWKEGITYVNESKTDLKVKSIDIVFVRDTSTQTGWEAYICLNTHTSSSELKYTDTEHWEKTSQNVTGIFASIILAKNAVIDLLQGNSIIIQTNEGIGTAGITGSDEAGGVRIWAGSTFANRGAAPFRVDLKGNAYASSIIIEGNSVFRSSIETYFVDLKHSDAVVVGSTGLDNIYRLNTNLNISTERSYVQLPNSPSYIGKRITIANNTTIYTRTDQMTHISVQDNQPIYGLTISAETELSGKASWNRVDILTGVIELVGIPASNGKTLWFVTSLRAASFKMFNE